MFYSRPTIIDPASVHQNTPYNIARLLLLGVLFITTYQSCNFHSDFASLPRTWRVDVSVERVCELGNMAYYIKSTSWLGRLRQGRVSTKTSLFGRRLVTSTSGLSCAEGPAEVSRDCISSSRSLYVYHCSVRVLGHGKPGIDRCLCVVAAESPEYVPRENP